YVLVLFSLLVLSNSPRAKEAGNDRLQLRRAISIQAEGKKLLEKHAIAPSAARLCWMRPQQKLLKPAETLRICHENAEELFDATRYDLRFISVEIIHAHGRYLLIFVSETIELRIDEQISEQNMRTTVFQRFRGEP